MMRRDRHRLYAAFANNGGRDDEEEPFLPKQPSKPQVQEPTTDEGEDDNASDWTFDPGDVTATVEVDPDGTTRATKHTHQGNSATFLERARYMFTDRDKERKHREKMEAAKLKHEEEMEALRQSQAEFREQINARKEAKRLEQKNKREAAEREAERKRAEKQERREREEAERAERELARKQRHERSMHILDNLGNILESIVGARIRQSSAIMQQAQDQVRFHDERQREYVGKINVAKEQRGMRFDKDLEVICAQFGMVVPDEDTMMQPAISDMARVNSCKRRTYVGSYLVTGVRSINATQQYIEFIDRSRTEIPGAGKGYLVTYKQLMPHVFMIHIHLFTPQLLASQGNDSDDDDPFECCKSGFKCNIQ